MNYSKFLALTALACMSNMLSLCAYEALIPGFNTNTTTTINLSDLSLVGAIDVGDGPFGVLANPVQLLAYTVNYNSGTVSVIDTTTNTTINTISVGFGPYLMVITPNGTKGYVTNYDSNTVSVLDLINNAVTATISVGDGPFGIAITPNGNTVYVLNYHANTVNVINTSTDTISSTITVGYRPYYPAITSNGRYLYVPNSEEGTVSIIDTTTDTVTLLLSLPGGSATVSCVVFNPLGTEAWVPDTNGTHVYVFDTANPSNPPSVVNTGISPSILSFSLDGRKAYIPNEYGSTVTVVDALDKSTITTIPVGVNPYVAATTPDGTQVFVTNYTSNSVSVIDIATDTIDTTIAVTEQPYLIAFVETNPPTNLTGSQKKRKFLSQTDIVNVLHWNPPSEKQPLLTYNIYRDSLNNLIGTVPANGKLSFEDHNRVKNTPYTYYVAGAGVNGTIYSIAATTVEP